MLQLVILLAIAVVLIFSLFALIKASTTKTPIDNNAEKVVDNFVDALQKGKDALKNIKDKVNKED